MSLLDFHQTGVPKYLSNRSSLLVAFEGLASQIQSDPSEQSKRAEGFLLEELHHIRLTPTATVLW